MKTSLLLFIALGLITLSSAKAQQEYFEYGFKGGVNVSSINGDVPSSYESRTAMHIGAFGIYKVLPKLGIQAELLYSEQGVSNEYTTLGTSISYDEVLRTQYIQLPVMASYNLIENLWVEGGVQVGYLAKAEREIEEVTEDSLGSVNSSTETIDENDSYESFDLGLAGGLRYKLNRNFMIQARYTQSLNDINSEMLGNQFNGILSFSVGFIL